MAFHIDKTANRIAFLGARLIDPATGLDIIGDLFTDGEVIADFGPDLFAAGVPEGAAVVECGGLCLCPGLVDIRVQLREPGEEHKGTLASTGRAACRLSTNHRATDPSTAGTPPSSR